MYGYYYYYDPTYFLVLIGLVIGLVASLRVKSTYAKYSKVYNARGLTAAEVAERILWNAGINDVSIEQVSGDLTDHYSPKEKVLRLSSSVYHSTSVGALGVAAHECGHAIQHATGYVPIAIRNTIYPVVNISNHLAVPMVILGLALSATGLIQFGILLFLAVVAFQIITLPVEFNASRRAIRILDEGDYLDVTELRGAKAVLGAAAMTYVAATISTILQLLRLILLSKRRKK